MSFVIQEISGSIKQTLAEDIQLIFSEAFGVPTGPDFLNRVNEKHNLVATIAVSDENLVGFKLGYEKHRNTFFSWLGAVSPKRQRMGISRQLIRHQHSSRKNAGYDEVQTETSGSNSEMLILNLQEGFSIFGSHLSRNNEMTVQLRKKL